MGMFNYCIALKRINHAAIKYEEELSNRDFLAIYKEDGKLTKHKELSFRPQNFLHLTGMYTNIGSAKEYYLKALEGSLDERDVAAKFEHLARKKLDVLPLALNFYKHSFYIGSYKPGSKKNFYADELLGTEDFSVGFIKTNGKEADFIAPCSVLDDNIRTISNYKPVVAILRKKRGEKEYSEITFLNNKINCRNLFISENLCDKLSKDCVDVLFPRYSEKKNQMEENGISCGRGVRR